MWLEEEIAMAQRNYSGLKETIAYSLDFWVDLLERWLVIILMGTLMYSMICICIFTKILATKFIIENYLLYGLCMVINGTMLMCNDLLFIFCMQIFVILQELSIIEKRYHLWSWWVVTIFGKEFSWQFGI